MPARIEILQWREAFDDEDSLSVGVFADGDKTNFDRQVCAEQELDHIEDHPGKDYDELDHAFLNISEITIFDGEIIEHNGRAFQINIVEVQRAAV